MRAEGLSPDVPRISARRPVPFFFYFSPPLRPLCSRAALASALDYTRLPFLPRRARGRPGEASIFVGSATRLGAAKFPLELRAAARLTLFLE